jgi:hypothetical protein
MITVYNKVQGKLIKTEFVVKNKCLTQFNYELAISIVKSKSKNSNSVLALVNKGKQNV